MLLDINHNLVVRTLQIITHLMFFLGVYLAFSNGLYSYLSLSLLFYYLFGIVGINVGFHRYLAHRSFKTNKFWHYVLTIAGTLCVMGSPTAWTVLHRQHHRYSDTPDDPHSPHYKGPLSTWLGFWGEIKLNPVYGRDMMRDRFQTVIHRFYLVIHICYMLLLYLLDPLLVIYVYAIPAVLIFHSAGAFDVIAHMHGYRTYETTDKSTNSWIANIITMGEGWHNNHHRHPAKWKQGEKWWEIDPPSWFIGLIKKN